jgi:rhodanese-related sulfurtransferase
MIPTAKNIPLPEFEEALELPEKDFEKKYGFPKMKKAEVLIVHCRTGGRSAVAAAIAEKRGYQVRNFLGSIWEWATIDPNVKRYGPSP